MKNYIYILFLLVAFASCEESELIKFSEKDAVYFQLMETDYDGYYQYLDDWHDYKGDSVVYSFMRMTEDRPGYKEKDTIWLQVNLTGLAANRERNFKVNVNANESTAEEGVHYEALEMQYPMPADTVRTSFPVIVFNHESLGNEPFTLQVELEANDNFDQGLEGRTIARIQLFDAYVKPLVWDQRYSFEYYLGPWSRAKHEVIVLTNGGIPIPHTKAEYNALKAELGNYFEYYKWKTPMNDYLTENEVYDENGNRVMPW